MTADPDAGRTAMPPDRKVIEPPGAIDGAA